MAELVIIKKINSRKIISVIDAMLNSAFTRFLRFSSIARILFKGFIVLFQVSVKKFTIHFRRKIYHTHMVLGSFYMALLQWLIQRVQKLIYMRLNFQNQSVHIRHQNIVEEVGGNSHE